ncbi:hypothetical protein ACFVYA_12880 [Amycolatopsis sp. NPDC058278]|uniref:hypothetical protein n=1 Tax=Amycolatopsis sp. NPDC058278 TaxID=3346417 RepID=UPI0036DF5E4E
MQVFLGHVEIVNQETEAPETAASAIPMVSPARRLIFLARWYSLRAAASPLLAAVSAHPRTASARPSSDPIAAQERSADR